MINIKKLREELAIDEYLELLKEDPNCSGAYVSFAQYMNILEKELQQRDEIIQQQHEAIGKVTEYIKDKINKSFKYDYGIDVSNSNDRLFTETVIELELIFDMLTQNKKLANNKEDSIDSITFYVSQKLVDDMAEITKDYDREQFIIKLLKQNAEITKLKLENEKLKKIHFSIQGGRVNTKTYLTKLQNENINLKQTLNKIRETVERECNFNGTALYDRWIPGNKILKIIDNAGGND